MVYKKFVLTGTILTLVLVFTFLPSNWLIVYKHYSLNCLKYDICSPINFISRNKINNTFGADRLSERKHEGIDLFASVGTPVYSAVAGNILFLGRDVLGGNVLKILGEDNRIYYYAHLDSYLDLKEGQRISRGELIGYVGNTGNAVGTPSHLHFEIMEIKWLFPLMTENINPYYELKF